MALIANAVVDSEGQKLGPSAGYVASSRKSEQHIFMAIGATAP